MKILDKLGKHRGIWISILNENYKLIGHVERHMRTEAITRRRDVQKGTGSINEWCRLKFVRRNDAENAKAIYTENRKLKRRKRNYLRKLKMFFADQFYFFFLSIYCIQLHAIDTDSVYNCHRTRFRSYGRKYYRT